MTTRFLTKIPVIYDDSLGVRYLPGECSVFDYTNVGEPVCIGVFRFLEWAGDSEKAVRQYVKGELTVKREFENNFFGIDMSSDVSRIHVWTKNGSKNITETIIKKYGYSSER